MDISDWRDKIDDVDRRLAALLNERAIAVVEIGRLKRKLGMPIYEPNRETQVLENVQTASQGPLIDSDLSKIYERLLDVMRNIQKREIAPDEPAKETQIDAPVED